MSEKSMIEMLPQDVLIKTLSGVEHDDLKSLFCVSKSIREAALVAKQKHFAYRTPKKRLAVRNVIHFDDWGELEAPNAPKQRRIPQCRVIGMDAEEWWPRRDLLKEMESE